MPLSNRGPQQKSGYLCYILSETLLIHAQLDVK